MNKHLEYLKKRVNIFTLTEPFGDWFTKIVNKVYLFHGWDVSDIDAKIQELKPMVEPKFNNETRYEVEHYLLYGEYRKYRKYLVASDFTPLAKDIPDLLENYILRKDFEKIFQEYRDSYIREVEFKAHEEAFRERISPHNDTMDTLIKLMKERLNLSTELSKRNDEIKKLANNNLALADKIIELEMKIKKYEGAENG